MSICATTVATATPSAPNLKPPRTATTCMTRDITPQLRQRSALPIERCSHPCDISMDWNMPRSAMIAQECARRPPLLPQKYDRQIFAGHRKYRCGWHDEERQRRQCRLVLLPKRNWIGLQLAQGRAPDGVYLRERREDGVLIQRYRVLIIAHLLGAVEQPKAYAIDCLGDCIRDRESHYMQPKTDHRFHFIVESRKAGSPWTGQPGPDHNAQRIRDGARHQRPVAKSSKC